MSDTGEKTCPLCAEEMDLTDQQLKPCKCGYQVCVWCWHHIIDMAEKDETEGRCPACRNPYDKQKIVGTAANCERLASEVNSERRKTQKTKPKPSEARKQLSSVRVIQRNLVYIVGLPLDLADEDNLQRKEHFGQYGRVLKVSMSRTATGVVQQFPNNTCSVYITYSTEEEAIRCIQSVHGFVLDGRSLKACFGTTKYCHAWLRNVPCTNRDCLYLHEVGPQEDSFTKDEIISAYTRVQQITGVIHNLPERSGSMLPPPLYDHCNDSSSAKPIMKASNNIPIVPKSSPPDGTTRSVTLPAAASWGSRSLNQPSATNSVFSNGNTKPKDDAVLSGAANPIDVSVLQNGVLKKPTPNENVQVSHTEVKRELPKLVKQQTPVHCQTDKSEKPSSPDSPPANIKRTRLSASASNGNEIVCDKAPNVTNLSGQSQQSCISTLLDGNTGTDEKVQISCTHGSLMSLERISLSDSAGVTNHKRLQSDCAKLPGKEVLQRHYDVDYRQVSALQMSEETAVLSNEGHVSRSEYVARTDLETLVGTNADSQVEEDTLLFSSQRHKDPEIMSCSVGMPRPANFNHLSNHMPSHLSQYNGDLGMVDSVSNSFLFASSGSDGAQVSFECTDKLGGGFAPFDSSLENSFSIPDKAMNVKQSRPFLGDFQVDANVDSVQDNIIASILSLDLDESSISPQNLARLFRQTESETSSLRLPQGNNQSRFSFARQEEESNNQAFESYDIFNQRPDRNIFGHNSVKSQNPYSDKFGGCNGVSPSHFMGSDNLASSPTVFSSNKLSKVSRAPVAAPPGFSIPNRSPPPGFSSNMRMQHAVNAPNGSPLFDSSLSSNLYQTPSVQNLADMELMDPAILAIGQGRLQNGLDNAGLDLTLNFPARFNALENEAKFQQLLMQNPLSQFQNARFSGTGDNNFLGNSHGFSSGLSRQSQGTNLSPFSQLPVQHHSRNPPMPNGHWDGWNKEVGSGIRLGMADFLENERMGFNKLYGNYEGSSFGMPRSGDIYNGAYRI